MFLQIISAMLEPKREILQCLVKSKTNFILFGSKSSGKTYFLKEILSHTKTQYIYLTCAITEDRKNFLALFNFEFKRYLLSKNFEEFSEESIFHKTNFNLPTNLEPWIYNLRKLGANHEQFFEELGRIYIFIDQIEDLPVSESFLSYFYHACTSQLKYFKFSLIFCGITNKDQLYSLEDPFKSVLTFCIDKPNIKPVIKDTIEKTYRAELKIEKSQRKQIQKLFDYLQNAIWHKFESIENDLSKIKKITYKIVKQSIHYITPDMKKVIQWIHSPYFKDLTNEIAEYGPLNQADINMRKEEKKMEGAENYTDYYSNLFLTAIHLAEGGPENQDRRRFVDYRRSKTQPKFKNQSMVKMKSTVRKPDKVVRNNLQRIISIAEVLQSQTQRGPQKKLQHHSLDFYGCIEDLKENQKLVFLGKESENNLRVYGGKVRGKAKEDQVRYFMKNKLDLDYNQFMG